MKADHLQSFCCREPGLWSEEWTEDRVCFITGVLICQKCMHATQQSGLLLETCCDALDFTRVAYMRRPQPTRWACFLQIGLVDMLKEEYGIEPAGMLGHSAGEIPCGYADGCLTREQTILIAYHRGEPVQGTPVALLPYLDADQPHCLPPRWISTNRGGRALHWRTCALQASQWWLVQPALRFTKS